MNEDGVLRVVLFALLVCVRRRDGEERAVDGKSERRDGSLELRQLAEPLFVPAVPDVDEAVGPAGGKRAEGLVECNRIDRIDAIVRPVAFEGIVLHRIRLVKVLERDAALDGPDGEALFVGERRHAARLVAERRVVDSVRRLPVARAQVVDEDLALRGRDDHERVADVHGVAPLRERDDGGGRRLPEVPELDRRVPRPRGDAVHLW
mmetsp:Transcript_8671/g.29785  ORF Transcript_8671/g.29785 Transcript_8671/m.29785 type:complete len:206 (+) Transcript_8671:10504-11121(+)